MIEEVQIKILRLNTGEDIIGMCVVNEETSSIDIEAPMRVILRRSPAGKSILLMAPWLPFELIEEDSATINFADIITVISPNKHFIEYYTTTVIELKGKFAAVDEEEDLLQDVSDYDEEEDEDFENEMRGAIEESKKGMLH